MILASRTRRGLLLGWDETVPPGKHDGGLFQLDLAQEFKQVWIGHDSGLWKMDIY